jgi:hypothetical protein
LYTTIGYIGVSKKKGNTIIVKELVDGINMEFMPGDAVEADGERMIT